MTIKGICLQLGALVQLSAYVVWLRFAIVVCWFLPSLTICIFPLSWTRSYIAESFFKLRAVTTSGYFPFCYSREFVSATSHYFYFCLENWFVCRLVIFLQWLVVHSHIVPLFFLCYGVHSYFVQVFFARVIGPFIHPRVIFISLVVIGFYPGCLFHFIFTVAKPRQKNFMNSNEVGINPGQKKIYRIEKSRNQP